MMDVTIKFNEDELTDDGRALLAAVTSQSRHLSILLAPRDGVVYATLADNDELGNDDVVRVNVTDRLSWAERARRYGIYGLEQDEVRRTESGGYLASAHDPGAYIPTEEAIAQRVAAYEQFYGDDEGNPARRKARVWEVPDDIIGRVRRGELGGAAVWNALAAEFTAWCEAGQFEVVISPDWISMTAAAEEFGQSLNTVRQAAARGTLATWDDWREPNPQRRTRVSREEAKRLWPGAVTG